MLPSFIHVRSCMVSGIFAAAMSSSSSYLLISGSAVAERTSSEGLIKKNATDAQVMIVARITLMVILLFGIIFIAIDENSIIFQVVSYAWAGARRSVRSCCSRSVGKRTNLPGAVAGMLTGAIGVVVWHELIKPLGGIFGVYELLRASSGLDRDRYRLSSQQSPRKESQMSSIPYLKKQIANLKTVCRKIAHYFEEIRTKKQPEQFSGLFVFGAV